ncbi:coiled-coil domain-containing protein 154-like isoform X2 [Babylonia areolata]
MRVLESRLGVTEKSNRSLLEEVCRLQNELRMTVTRNEQAIYDEKQARMQLDTSLHKVNDLISQLTKRVSGAEDKLLEEKTALSSLVSHTKGVEKAILASQEDMQSGKDNHRNKLLDLQSKIVETQRAKEQLEKIVYSISDEMRVVRNKMEGQQADFNTVITDLRLRSRRLEEENKLQLSTLRKQGDIQSHTEQNTSFLRGQVESRLSELRDVILDLRARQDAEINERRTLEQLLQQKVSELNMGLGEQNRKREEAVHAMDMAQKERERAAETEKLRLQSKLSENIEEMNKRLLNKEVKLREEIQEKYQQQEKALQREREKHTENEQKLRDENETKWAALRKQLEEEVRVLKEEVKNNQGVRKETVQKLDQSISLLDKQLQEQKRQADKLMAAEIKSRKEHEQQTAESVQHVEEKIQVATSTLQQAISAVTEQLSKHDSKLLEEMKEMISTSEQGTTRAVADMDACLQSMKQKVATLQQLLDDRVTEGTATLAQGLREQVVSISMWQDVTSQTMKDMEQNMQKMPEDINAIEEKQELLKAEMDSRISSEAESRIRDIENLKKEIAELGKSEQPEAADQTRTAGGTGISAEAG